MQVTVIIVSIVIIVIMNVLLIQCMTNIANVLNTIRVNPLLIVQCMFVYSVLPTRQMLLFVKHHVSGDV